ncbi:MAG: sterol desaturase/sphingolipid hydroxylase (fatty acid hydroxylase superfamily) [Saprospiraceae bacterium]|jgi:sterol desaturase/sphingolipid hydroxylase (fatty acid hydroxylase superfamily)
MKYLETFFNGYKGFAAYLWNDVTHPGWNSYFYWLILVSLFFFALEVSNPWRKEQPRFRKDFWLDFFYMFFNFFLFSLIIYNAFSDVVVTLIKDGMLALGVNMSEMNPLWSLPVWAVLLIGFVLRDFIQWWTHRLLHRVSFLWEFHKVHHSVEQMGFAAHLRYHWMETIVYRTIEYLPLAFLIGLRLDQFFVIHIFTLAVGHFNHSNITVKGWIKGGVLGFLLGIVIGFGLGEVNLFANVGGMMSYIIVAISTLIGSIALGPIMKYLFNSPEMHIWHHAYELPKNRKYGINYGLTLAIWDYLFGTAEIPHDGRNIRLGFPGIEAYPKNFIGQVTSGFKGE